MSIKTLVGIGFGVIAVMLVYAQGGPPQQGGVSKNGTAGRGGGRGGDSQHLPTQAQWDSNAKTQEYVAKAKAIAGDDPDLKFDEGVFCQASGGATNQDRATIGVPDSLPHLTPFPAPNPKVSLGIERLFDNWTFSPRSYGRRSVHPKQLSPQGDHGP
jgi:hypothetical protein